MPAKKLKRKTGPGRLSVEETAKISDRLLDAALDLFSKDGFERTSMERIAKAAGASTKTIYSRYANKELILKEVVERMIARTLGAIATGFPADMGQVDPRVFLMGLGRSIGVTLGGAGASGINRLVFAEAVRFPELAKAYAAIIGNRIAMVSEALRKWSAVGVIGPVPDVEAAAMVCISLLTDRIRIWGVLGTPMPPDVVERYLSTAVGMFLKALDYKPKAAAGPTG